MEGFCLPLCTNRLPPAPEDQELNLYSRLDWVASSTADIPFLGRGCPILTSAGLRLKVFIPGPI